MSKFTKGPWRREEGTNLVWGKCDSDETTAYGLGKPVAKAIVEARFDRHEVTLEEAWANADLMAAAPDLYEAAQQQMAQLQLLANLVDDDTAVMAIIEASMQLLGIAIRKAEGGGE